MTNPNKISAVKERLKQELDEIWLSEPADIVRIKADERLEGAFEQKGAVLLQPTYESGGIVNLLVDLRSMAKAGEVDSKALGLVAAKLIESRAEKWRRYFFMEETTSLMEEVAAALKVTGDKVDLVSILEGLLLYLGKFNWWLDSTIPWASVFAVIDSDVRQQQWFTR